MRQFGITITLTMLWLSALAAVPTRPYTTTYTYDDRGNIVSRTSVRGLVTNAQTAEDELAIVSASPVPTTDVLNVQRNDETDLVATYQLFNSSGVPVATVTTAEPTTQIQMSQLPAGTYILVITIGEETQTVEVFKQ